MPPAGVALDVPPGLFISNQRAKLLNAMVFFVRSTKRCHTLKLFKLLNFLDFEHYRQTGRSVTGLEYKAWPQGPAPAALWRELHEPAADMQQAVAVIQVKDDLTGAPLRRDIIPRAQFDQTYFTPREMEIMNTLAYMFAETPGEDMSQISHARNLPWDIVFAGGSGSGRVIPYSIATEAGTIIGAMPSLSKEDSAMSEEIRRLINIAPPRLSVERHPAGE